jgi:hypothetical protein
MRRVPLLLVLAAAVSLGAAGPADANGRCAVKGSGTIRKTAKVRVYWDYVQSDNADVLFGCVRSTGLTRRLYAATRGIGNYYQGVKHLHVNGYRVAFSSWAFYTLGGPPFASDDRIVMVNVWSGRHRLLKHVRDHESRRLAAGVDALVLDRCGRIAYRASVTNGYADFEHPDPRLLTWIRGKRHFVDRGDVERRSIRFEPQYLEWVRDGAERSTSVEPVC